MRTILVILASLALPASVPALTLDFESAPASNGCVQHGTTLVTQGFVFTNGGGSNRLFGCDGTNLALASNGTNALLDDSGLSDVVVVESGGASFDFLSFSVAEVFVSDSSQDATSIQAVGFRNGSLVAQTAVLNLDGTNDGPGGSADFQTFLLPASFTNLDQIRIAAVTGGPNGHLFFLDDLAVVIVPEPGTAALFALGLVAFGARHRTCKALDRCPSGGRR